jgi:hypothetical protein
MKDLSISKMSWLIVLLGSTLLTTATAHANTFTVNTTADLPDDGFGATTCHTSAGTCSLRAAIMKANQINGTNVIQIPAGTYLLTIPPSGFDEDDTGDLNLPSPTGADQGTTIRGAGAGSTIIDGNQTDGVIGIGTGRRVFIEGLTIRNGQRNSGGGIYNTGLLTITHSVIEGNLAIYGGGIDSSGELDVVGSTFRSNVAIGGSSGGGGMFLAGSTRVRDSSLYDNGADTGGGIFVAGTSLFLSLVNSTISGNYATSYGGGIASMASTFLYNTSVIGNDADHDHDEEGGLGGGIIANAGSRFVVFNSLIAGNTIRNTPIPDNCDGALEAYGLTLLDDPTGCTTTTSNANLGFVSLSTIGPLQDNGGPTWTHALLAGSEAIDGTPASQGCIDYNSSTLTTDQRGAARVVGTRCDVGAFEYGALTDHIFKSGFESGSASGIDP